MGEYTRNSIMETFLGYSAQDRLTMVLSMQGVVGRLLRVVGIIIEDCLAEEHERMMAPAKND